MCMVLSQLNGITKSLVIDTSVTINKSSSISVTEEVAIYWSCVGKRAMAGSSLQIS